MDVSGKDKYVVEFDATIKPGDNQATYFAVKGTDFQYISNGKNPDINEVATAVVT